MKHHKLYFCLLLLFNHPIPLTYGIQRSPRSNLEINLLRQFRNLDKFTLSNRRTSTPAIKFKVSKFRDNLGDFLEKCYEILFE